MYKSLETIYHMTKVHTWGKQYLSLLYTMYTNTSNNTSFYIDVASLYVVWKFHPLDNYIKFKNWI